MVIPTTETNLLSSDYISRMTDPALHEIHNTFNPSPFVCMQTLFLMSYTLTDNFKDKPKQSIFPEMQLQVSTATLRFKQGNIA